jgi:DNA-binding CsgD family transcriptional regulator
LAFIGFLAVLPGVEIMSIVETAPTAHDAMRRLREAIDRLLPEEKEVFLVRQNRGLSYEQVAQLHQRSVELVKQQMRSALRKLRLVVQEVSAGLLHPEPRGRKPRRCPPGPSASSWHINYWVGTIEESPLFRETR